jgi:hypothetical protein
MNEAFRNFWKKSFKDVRIVRVEKTLAQPSLR